MDALGQELPAPMALDRFLQYLPLAATNASDAAFVPHLLTSLQGRVFAQFPVLLFEQIPPTGVNRVQCL